MKKRSAILSVFLGMVLFAWGCQQSKPLAPSRIAALTLTVPQSKELKASLLGASNNELLYYITGDGMQPVYGVVGPFSTASDTGNINLNLNVPAGGDRLVSLQLNNSDTHQPLAVGAGTVDLSGSVSSASVSIELGSVARNCYTLTNIPTGTNYVYDFNDDLLMTQAFAATTPTASNNDVMVATTFGPYDLEDPTESNNTVAFIGNGDLVNFDFVPSDDRFSSYSYNSKRNAVYVPPTPIPTSGGGPTKTKTPSFVHSSNAYRTTTYTLETGDVYCVKLSSLPGGHAWVQVIDPGSVNAGPTFRYRVNSTLPYYAYEQTSADVSSAGACNLGW
jgi:hypothetical protein